MDNWGRGTFTLYVSRLYRRADAYRAMSVVEKSNQALLVKMPAYLELIGHMFLVVIVLLLLAKHRKEALIKVAPYLIATLCGLAAVSYGPSTLPRTLSPVYYFALISSMIALPMVDFKKYRKGLAVLGALVSLVFVREMVLMAQGYVKIHKQARTRTALIEAALEEGRKEVTIPNWYTTNVIKDRHMFDTYHSGSISRYFGIKVHLANVGQDYTDMNIDEVKDLIRKK